MLVYMVIFFIIKNIYIYIILKFPNFENFKILNHKNYSSFQTKKLGEVTSILFQMMCKLFVVTSLS